MRRARIKTKSSSDRGLRGPASRPRYLKLHDGRVIKFPAVMGVLNVTPDSFSDGGRYLDADRAVEHALAMEAAGADLIDVGGESSRPTGASEVPIEVELARVGPVLARLGKRLGVPISIDTRRAEVARVALESGAAIINDITRALARLRDGAAGGANQVRGGADAHARRSRQSYRSSRATATWCARSSNTSGRARDLPPRRELRARE